MDAESLLNYLDGRTGRQFRGAVEYDEADTEVLYLRDDVREERIVGEIHRMLERLRPESSLEASESFPFGALRASVRIFEDAVLLHFPRSENEGLIVSLEPEAAGNITTFIGECEMRLNAAPKPQR
jgi:hypothetical protein